MTPAERNAARQITAKHGGLLGGTTLLLQNALTKALDALDQRDALLEEIRAESDDLNMAACCQRGLSAELEEKIRAVLPKPKRIGRGEVRQLRRSYQFNPYALAAIANCEESDFAELEFGGPDGMRVLSCKISAALGEPQERLCECEGGRTVYPCKVGNLAGRYVCTTCGEPTDPAPNEPSAR